MYYVDSSLECYFDITDYVSIDIILTNNPRICFITVKVSKDYIEDVRWEGTSFQFDTKPSITSVIVSLLKASKIKIPFQLGESVLFLWKERLENIKFQ